jgi:hypothetical protein
MIRYEDMYADTVSVLEAVLRFAGMVPSPVRLAEAVAASDRGRLQELEQKQRSAIQEFVPSADPSIPFVRKGVVGDWQNHLTDDMLDDFAEVHGSALRRVNYL